MKKELPEPIDVERDALVRIVDDGPFHGLLGTFVEVLPTGYSRVRVPGEKIERGKPVPCSSVVMVRKVDPSPIIVWDDEAVEDMMPPHHW